MPLSVAPNRGNVISNCNNGLNLQASNSVIIQGNRIGTSIDGLTAMSNDGASGILVTSCPNILIGGNRLSGEGNVISASGMFSSQHGIEITSTTLATIQGNLIGTDSNGDNDLGNAGAGIYVPSGNDVLIGGFGTDFGNVISGSGTHGVHILSSSTNVDVRYNIIGLNLAGDAVVPNTNNGIFLDNANAGMEFTGNVISGNLMNGILLPSSGSSEVIIDGNLIGTDPTGGSGGGIGNQWDGIRILSFSGISLAQPVSITNNTISGNGQASFGDGIIIGSSSFWLLKVTLSVWRATEPPLMVI